MGCPDRIRSITKIKGFSDTWEGAPPPWNFLPGGRHTRFAECFDGRGSGAYGSNAGLVLYRVSGEIMANVVRNWGA
jgi:hypothetical protein